MCSGCWPAPVRQYRQSYSCVCFCQGLWSLAMYCLVCSAYGGSISDGMVNVRRHSPPVFLYCHIYFPDNRFQCLSRLGMVLTGGRGQPEIQIDTFLPNT